MTIYLNKLIPIYQELRAPVRGSNINSACITQVNAFHSGGPIYTCVGLSENTFHPQCNSTRTSTHGVATRCTYLNIICRVLSQSTQVRMTSRGPNLGRYLLAPGRSFCAFAKHLIIWNQHICHEVFELSMAIASHIKHWVW